MKPHDAYDHDWTKPLPRIAMRKPSWRRGQDGESVIKIPMPQEPPLHKMKSLVEHPNGDRTITLKRPFFDAFDGIAAQDGALAKRRWSYDHDLPQRMVFEAKKRRDSMQDDGSTSGTSQTQDSVELLLSPPPTEQKQPPPAIVLSTEPAPATQDKPATIPRELEIDGNAGFDPLQTSDKPDADTIKTYSYKGRRYEVQGDEPPEWLVDVKESPKKSTQASKATPSARKRSRASLTPNTSSSQTRRSSRTASNNTSTTATNIGYDERRRSKRARRSVVASQPSPQDDLFESFE